LQTLGSELSRVSHITKQTLEFYRDGKTPAPVDLAGPLNAAISLFSRKAHLAGAKIETDYRTSAVTFGFAGELRQVFANLIGNSIEAGATTIKIRVSAGRDWKHHNRRGVRITFADNGSGIPADSAGKLFEPFFTTKDEKGTGLGLWVSRGIVQKHEGWMTMSIRVAWTQASSKASARSERTSSFGLVMLEIGAPTHCGRREEHRRSLYENVSTSRAIQKNRSRRGFSVKEKPGSPPCPVLVRWGG
jgi:light-regulated signal transduction histidine kinase (bacteriophytochrome)